MEMFKILVLLLSLCCFCEAQHTPTFYDQTCPNALSTIQQTVRSAIIQEPRMGASLIRLHVLDCFLGGCDASIMLVGTQTLESERDSPRISGSARGFEVIDEAKAAVENVCPGVVSCADIIAVAARDSIATLGGPSYEVLLGRRDSTESFIEHADTDLPTFNDTLEKLTELFDRKGLDTRDLVALSGAHSLGQAQCDTFRDRLYNEFSDIDAGFATRRKLTCRASGGDTNLAPLDEVTPNIFDNVYYLNLMQKRGLLATDQVLFGTGASTDSIVSEYRNNPFQFWSDFKAAMIKMGEIEYGLIEAPGEIRRICSKVN